MVWFGCWASVSLAGRRMTFSWPRSGGIQAYGVEKAGSQVMMVFGHVHP